MQIRIVDTDAEKLSLISQVRAEGLQEALIYTLKECTDEHWLDILKHAWTFTVYDGNKPCGITWFDNQNGYSAWCHYLLFKEYMPRAAELGMIPIKWLEDKLGVRTLLGITPKPYRHSFKLMQAWGFKAIHTIPFGCYLAKYDRYTDGIFFMRTT